MKSVLGVHWRDWCWSWNSNTLATWCKELTHWKRPQCLEGLGAGGEGDDRGWDGWMASPTQWTWVWVNSGSWWWTGRPGVLQSMGLHTTEWLNWTELNIPLEPVSNPRPPSRSSQSTEPRILFSTAGSHQLSMGFCQCYFFNPSHLPLPPCPHIHSLCLPLILYSCPENRFICTIFLDPTYMH